MKQFQGSRGCPVLGHLKAGILPYIVIYKKVYDRSGAFINAQKTIGRIMREKEQYTEGRKVETTSDGQTFQISHQAISCITSKSIKVMF